MIGDKLRAAYDAVGQHMDEILGLFLPGAKITVLVRRPGEPTKDFLMTDDDLDEAIAMIRRRVASSPPQINPASQAAVGAPAAFPSPTPAGARITQDVCHPATEEGLS